jgi:hypothetical protein
MTHSAFEHIPQVTLQNVPRILPTTVAVISQDIAKSLAIVVSAAQHVSPGVSVPQVTATPPLFAPPYRRLDPGRTRHDEGRVVYLTPEIATLLEGQLARVEPFRSRRA